MSNRIRTLRHIAATVYADKRLTIEQAAQLMATLTAAYDAAIGESK